MLPSYIPVPVTLCDNPCRRVSFSDGIWVVWASFLDFVGLSLVNGGGGFVLLPGIDVGENV
jgi:hypothetical protein